MNEATAIKKINENGMLLVFPIKSSAKSAKFARTPRTARTTRVEKSKKAQKSLGSAKSSNTPNSSSSPNSLWHEFYPRSEMRWVWDDNHDPRIWKMWSLMKSLSANTEVVYSKWYQSRATFFSRELFTAMLAVSQKTQQEQEARPQALMGKAREILDVLESDSPLSTKQVKALVDLRGRDNEPTYARALKTLFSQFYIVGFGEVDDGAFPSLAIGATQVLYEDLWTTAEKMSLKSAVTILDRSVAKGSLFRTHFEKIIKGSSK